MASSEGPKEKTYTFKDGISLRVLEGKPKDQSRVQVGSQYGLLRWDSSIVVCRMIDVGILSAPMKGAVVELGAGCGLPGMLLAAKKIPGPVLLTDSDPAVITNLSGNVERSGLKDFGIDVCELDWRTPEHCVGLKALGAVELVIGCDLFYGETEEVLPDLVQTVVFLAKHGRDTNDADNDLLFRAIFAYEHRGYEGYFDDDSAEIFITKAKEAGFSVEGPLILPSQVFEGSEANDVQLDKDVLKVVVLTLEPATVRNAIQPSKL